MHGSNIYAILRTKISGLTLLEDKDPSLWKIFDEFSKHYRSPPEIIDEESSPEEIQKLRAAFENLGPMRPSKFGKAKSDPPESRTWVCVRKM